MNTTIHSEERGIHKLNIDGKPVCNMCGNTFDVWDEQQDAGIFNTFHYGSIYDGDKINCHMCCSCFDKMITEYILPNCRINPIEEEGAWT